jgi:hypothetical protein
MVLPVLVVAAFALGALVWGGLRAARTGRFWPAGLYLGAVLLGLLASYRYSMRETTGKALMRAEEAENLSEDLQAWRRVQAIQSRPAGKEWVEAGGSRTEGEVVGYSGLEATPEEALGKARKSARDKLEALVLKELVQRNRTRVDERVHREVRGSVEKLLSAPGAEEDRFEEAVRLPQSGETARRAAILLRAPQGWLRVSSGEVSSRIESYRKHLGWTVVSALVLALVIYLAYAFLNAGTKGHLAWPLRVISCAAFLLLCLGLFYLRERGL